MGRRPSRLHGAFTYRASARMQSRCSRPLLATSTWTATGSFLAHRHRSGRTRRRRAKACGRPARSA